MACLPFVVLGCLPCCFLCQYILPLSQQRFKFLFVFSLIKNQCRWRETNKQENENKTQKQILNTHAHIGSHRSRTHACTLSLSLSLTHSHKNPHNNVLISRIYVYCGLQYICREHLNKSHLKHFNLLKYICLSLRTVGMFLSEFLWFTVNIVILTLFKWSLAFKDLFSFLHVFLYFGFRNLAGQSEERQPGRDIMPCSGRNS